MPPPAAQNAPEKVPPAALRTMPDAVQADDARNATPGATSSGSSSGAGRRNTRVAATGEMALISMSMPCSSAATPTMRPSCAILPTLYAARPGTQSATRKARPEVVSTMRP